MKEWSGVTVATVLAMVLNVAFASRDGSYPIGDDVLHVRASWLAAEEFLRTGSPWRLYFVGWNDAYPPLLYWVYTFFRALGLSHDPATLATLQSFVPLLAGGLYVLGRRLGGPVCGGVALLLGLGSPAALMYSRMYFLDVPLLGLVSASLACLLASEGFSKRGPSLGFGLGLALAMLLKWVAVLFLLPPAWLALWLHSRTPARTAVLSGLAALAALAVLAGTAVAAARLGPPPELRLGLWTAALAAGVLAARAVQPRNLAATWLAPLALAAPWYYVFAPALVFHLEFVFVQRNFDRALAPTDPGTWVNAVALARDGLLVPAGLVALVLALVLRPGQGPRDRWVLAGGLLVGFLGLIPLLFHEVRYQLPLVAFAAPLAAFAPTLLPAPLRGSGWAVLGLSGLLCMVGWVLPVPGARPATHADPARLRLLQWNVPPALGWLPQERPDRQRAQAILQRLGEGVVRWPPEAGLNPHWLSFEALRLGLPLLFDRDGRYARPAWRIERDPEGEWEVPGARLRLVPQPDPQTLPVELVARAQAPPPLPVWRPELYSWARSIPGHEAWVPSGEGAAPRPGREGP